MACSGGTAILGEGDGGLVWGVGGLAWGVGGLACGDGVGLGGGLGMPTIGPGGDDLGGF